MRPPNIFDRLRADHRHVLERIDALERTQAGVVSAGSSEAVGLLRLLERQFSTHVVTEEALLYPALELALAESAEGLRPLMAEHEELRSLLALLTASGPVAGTRAVEQSVIRLRDLIDLLRIHIRKEEAAVFPVAERVLSAQDIDSLTRRMDLGAPPPDVRSSTRITKGNAS